MKIDQIRLHAYGPFTDVTVDLTGCAAGLHILYGPNEAGKSSALRALQSLLFGIPERTPDGFLHPYPRLRVGARLRSDSGRTLAFTRRKGRANTLRGEDDETVVAEAELLPFLGGVDAAGFASLFGIDHGELVRGGEEIVTGGGDLGRTIFAAGSGMVHLRSVQEELLAECDALFKPSGQKPRLNELLRSLSSRRKELRQAELSGPEWAEHNASLERAREDKERLAADIAGVAREKSRLLRIRQALPILARRRELAARRKAAAPAPVLPEDFPETRRELSSRLRIAESERRRAEESAASIRESIRALPVDDRLLENAERIEALHIALGSQQKAERDRVRLLAQHEARKREEEELLAGLRKGTARQRALRNGIGKAEAARIRELGARYERIAARIQDLEEALPEARRSFEAVQKQLERLPEPLPLGALQAVLAEAESRVPREERLQEIGLEIEAESGRLEARCRELGLDSGRLTAGPALRLPSAETIRRFEEEDDRLRRRRGELDNETERVRDDLVEIDRRMAAERLDRDVPDEAALRSARRTRDAGWQLAARRLRGEPVGESEVREWTGLVDGPDAESADLVDAFPHAVSLADALADRLRREAERVTAKARLNADRKAGDERMRQLAETSKRLAAEEAEARRRWTEAWREAGVAPDSPREMRQWAREVREVMDRAAAFRERKVAAESLRSEIDRHRNQLTVALAGWGGARPAAVDPTLGTLAVEAAEIVAAETARNAERKERLQEKERRAKDLAALQARLDSARTEREEWARLWAEAVGPLGLDAGALPAEAAAVIDECNALSEKHREAGELGKRIQGIDRDAEVFRRQAADLAGAVGGSVAAEASAEATVLALNRRLRRARDTFSQRQTLDRHLKEETARIETARAAEAEARARLAEMCREAGCTDPEDLPEAERMSRLRSRLESEWEAVADRLRELSAGASVASLVAEVDAVDPDGLEARLERLEQEARRLEGEKSALDQRIGTEQAELARMDGGAGAAEIAEEMQSLLGRIEAEAERFALHRFAASVLQAAVERFRRKHQGPVLTRASELFVRLTLGSFSGVRADFDDRGRPRAVGVRPSGETVAVGGMSEGTADQLYLSFRLAGLERYLRRNEALPFVVDDILLQFDDHRAGAALDVLSDLSERTQVLFFTHHRHLVELARERLGKGRFCLHELGG